jgi:hypothetical protein
MGRRAALLSAWLPRAPRDAWHTRRVPLPAPFRRLYFFHIRKTGGTSLTKAFLGLGGEDPRAVEARIHPTTHSGRSGDYVFLRSPQAWLTRHSPYFFGFSHGPAWLTDLPADTFTLTVLRDPVTRVVSYYRYLRDERADEEELFGAPAAERAWAKDGVEAFLERTPRRHLETQLWMFSRQGDPEEAAARVRACTSYFFTESYDAGLAALSERLGLTLSARRDRQSVAGPSPSSAEIAMIRERLQSELRMMALLRDQPGASLVGTIPDFAEEPLRPA